LNREGIYRLFLNKIKCMSMATPTKRNNSNKWMVVGLLIASIFFATNNCTAQTATPKRALLALSKADHVLAIIDPVTLKIVAHVPIGPDPHEVVASADGKTAYVSNMGQGQSHEINVIDLVGQKALPNIDISPLSGPHGITFADGKVWFTAQDSKAIGRYDPATGKVDWCMGTGQDRTHMIYVTPDAKKIYTTNVSAGTVSIFEYVLQQPHFGPTGPPPGGQPAGAPMGQPGGQQFHGPKAQWDWKQTVIQVSKGSEGFDVSPNGREIWTAAADDGVISIIDTGTHKVTATIDAKAVGANRLKFTPDGKRVFVSSLRTGDVFVFDAATHKEFKKINLGHGCAGILMDAEGNRAFVASTGGNSIAVVDLKTLEVTGHIDLGGPDGMEWAVLSH
jgi:YVTN family beta-propeller protein